MADSVTDEEHLWRRVHHSQYVPCEGGYRVSSGAFKTAELSIDRVRILHDLGLGVPFTARDQPGVAEVTGGQLRAVDAEPEPDPIPPGDPYQPAGNPAHAIVRTPIKQKQADVLSCVCFFHANPAASRVTSS